MNWPLSQDYNEAVQNPADCFSDPELRSGEAATNAIGLPIPRSGNFADVYRFDCPSGKSWAIKLFTRKVHDLESRYAKIDAHLKAVGLPFFVGFEYQPEGIRIRDGRFPLLKMEWVEGLQLNEFVRSAVDKPGLLEGLVQIWVKLTRRLREAFIAHGDLQHGNVLLVPGRTPASLVVRLIDYDGMYLPALAAWPSGEVGHPSYQHPQRLRDQLYTAEVDRFPHLAVVTALKALMVVGPPLWEKCDNGDNLLFREEDFRQPHRSKLLRTLWKLDDPEVRSLVGRLVLAATGPMDAVPWVDELMPGGRVPPPDPRLEKEAAEALGLAAKVQATVPAELPPVPPAVPMGFSPTMALGLPPLPSKPEELARPVNSFADLEIDEPIATYGRRHKKSGGGATSIILMVLLLAIAGGMGYLAYDRVQQSRAKGTTPTPQTPVPEEP